MLHKTKEGNLIPIASMEDSHLLNTIKLKFKPYNVILETVNKELTSYLIGKEVVEKSMTPEAFNTIIARIFPYIIEGFRRSSTFQAVINILGNFNPVFKSTEKIDIPNMLLLPSKKVTDTNREDDRYNDVDNDDNNWDYGDNY